MRRSDRGSRAGWILALGLVTIGAAAACSSGSSDVPDSGASPDGTASSSSGGSGGGSSGGSSSGSSSGGSPDGGVTDARAEADAASAPVVLWDFDDPEGGLQGWQFNTYQTVADIGDANGFDPLNLSAQAPPMWDTSGGYNASPPGMMTVSIPYSAYNQKADYHVTTIPAAAMDLSQKQIQFWIKLDPGADGGAPFSPSPSAPGGIVLYAKSVGFHYGQVPYHNIVSTNYGWVQYTMDFKNAFDAANSNAMFDPTAIVEIGFFIHTGGGGAIADASSPYPPPTPATFHIDTITISPSP